MVRILHLGDLHLDSPFSGKSKEAAARMNAKAREVFRAAMRFARERAVDIVLLAGDLFDREYYAPATVKMLCDEMAALPECRFVISPGNHDCYTAHSPYRTQRFSANVYIFEKKEIDSVVFPELHTEVYGYAFCAPSYTEEPLCGFRVKEEGRLNLLCAHGEISTVSQYAPIRESSLAESGLDYAALGHIHACEPICRAGNTQYAYSGCLYGRDFGETGAKGGVLISAEWDGERKRVSAERVTLCPWEFWDIAVNVTGFDRVEQVVARAKELLPPADAIVTERYIRIALEGRTAEEWSLPTLSVALASLGDVTLCDETLCEISFAELEKDYTVRGAFYRALKPRLEAMDAEERRTAQTALRMGLYALEGGNPAEAE